MIGIKIARTSYRFAESSEVEFWGMKEQVQKS
jgi:hypothetical protein